MDVPALLRDAMQQMDLNEAGLARKLNRSQGTVNRWNKGESVPDYESCLLLARITGLPAVDVLKAAGHDTTLLPSYAFNDGDSPLEQELNARTRRLRDAVQAADGLPDEFVPVYLRAVLNRQEGEITTLIDMVMKLRHYQPQPRRPVNRQKRSRVNRPRGTDNQDTSAQTGDLTERYQGYVNALSSPLSGSVAAL